MPDFRYEHHNDVFQHLHQTIVMGKDGEPYYVRRGDNNDEWYYFIDRLGKGNAYENKDIRKAELSFEPIQLGYCQVRGGSCEYLMRRPLRMWKQGLSRDHLSAKSGVPLRDGVMRSKELRNTILGKYPSAVDAHSSARDAGVSTAFHRDFAILAINYPMLELGYKGATVGKVVDGNFEIDERFMFIKEHLEEVLSGKN